MPIRPDRKPKPHLLQAPGSTPGDHRTDFAVWELARDHAARFRIANIDAEQIASAVMDGVSNARKRDSEFLRKPEDLDRYVFSAVKNDVQRLIRRDSHFVSIDSVANRLTDQRADAAQPDDRLAFIYRVAEQLPEQCRKVWEMRYLDDLMPRQIAALLGLSVKTVDTQINRAMRRIRAACAEHRVKEMGEQS